MVELEEKEEDDDEEEEEEGEEKEDDGDDEEEEDEEEIEPVCLDFREDCGSHSYKITHPYHLQHPLTYTRLNTKSEINNAIQTKSPSIFDACSWCGNNPETWVYSCSICSFCLCLPCSQNNPPLTIANPKSHHHSLLFLPRPLLVPCDACGLVRASEASYTCFQCNYMVHESCMYLPRIIKLTRHSHRLSLTPFLPPSVLWCGVCYRAVDVRFGQYSCNHEDCSYVVHSKCATHQKVWDGRELEWEPENQEETEDVASFKKVGEDLIKHFSHEHHLKLENYDGVRDAKKQCEACILPIDPRWFYTCMQCDYSLHEVCAGLPRELDHPLHKHRLVLDTAPLDDYDTMTCSTCCRTSSGLRYKCVVRECMIEIVHIDLRCILIPDCCFTHKSHVHPLFVSVSYGLGVGGWVTCQICQKRCGGTILHCSKCEFTMCFRCATIPTELHYKHDEHPLTLCYGESVDDVGKYWCEVCEGGIDSKKWFYSCNQCCITVHRECIFGSSIYIKSGSTFNWGYYLVQIDSTNSVTRQICAICEERCKFSVCFTLIHEYGWDDKALCSFRCLRAAMWRISPEEDF